MIILDWPNEWPWHCCAKILDEDDDTELEKEQDCIDGAESSAKNPTYKIPELSLSEAIALPRDVIKLHTTQNIGF